MTPPPRPVPPYCCALAAYEGDTRHAQTCPESRQPAPAADERTARWPTR